MGIFSYTPPEVLFAIGPITIYSYGFVISLGILAAYGTTLYLAKLYDKALGLEISKRIDVILIILFVVGTLCARLLFVLYQWPYFSSHPQEIIALWHGGWVWHGGLVGGTLALVFYCKVKKLSFWIIADILSPGVVLAQAIGRWGNFFNQEAYGLPTNLIIGIPIDLAHRITGYEGFSQFHPAFLYESAWDLLVFTVLFLVSRMVILRIASSRAHTRVLTHAGIIFLSYTIFYSLGRFAVEFLRIDVVPVYWGLRSPQWISIIMIILAALFIGRNVLQKRKQTDRV